MIASIRSFAGRHLPQWVHDIVRHVPGLHGPPRAAHKFAFPDAPPTRAASPFNSLSTDGNILEQLGAKYLPTKRKNNYLRHYWTHCRDIRLDIRNVLEIGVQTDRSLRMWEEFFPQATIHGLDIDPKCRAFEGGRRRVHIGDQGDLEFLARVVGAAGAPFDIVIDDGSHVVEHQLRTFEYLFPQLSDHGIYVLEDTGGCVGDYNLVVVNALKTLIDETMFWPAGFEPSRWPELSHLSADAGWGARNIVGIAFYRWIVFVMRGHNPEDNPFLVGNP